MTAGAGGLGLVIARTLAGEGATVFVCDIDEEALAKLPGTVEGARVDVADPDAVADWLDPIAAAGVDLLVNNAGIAGPTKRLEDITPDEWRRCLAVGLDGQFHCARRVSPVMKRQRSGAIVNISSTAGFMGMPYRSPYVAAKFGVIGLTKALAMELGAPRHPRERHRSRRDPRRTYGSGDRGAGRGGGPVRGGSTFVLCGRHLDGNLRRP